MNRVWAIVNFIKCIRHFKGNVPYNEIRAPSRIKIERPSLVTLSGPVYFGPNFTLMNRSKVSIGENVIFGPNVCMIDYNHNFQSTEYIPYSGENIIRPITIGAHVWIGYGAIILPGVSIGEGAIIGAGAVVTRSIPECGIAVGNPARVIARRDAVVFDSLKKKKSAHYLLASNR